MLKVLFVEYLLPHLGTIIGFSLGFILIARLMRERRRPSSTFAWLLVIVLIPYVGVPLFLLIGGRKIAKLSRGKGPLNLLEQVDYGPNAKVSPFGVLADGNRCKFLPTGKTAFDTLIKEIQAAQTSIDITTFILSHDSVGRKVVRELSERAQEGVSVRLLLDAVGSFGKKTFYMLDLEKAGGRIERFMPVLPVSFPGSANLRNHRKIAIFDGKKAIIGGRNIGRDYMGPTDTKGRWRDYGVQIDGPAVMALNAIFEADWTFASRKRNETPRSHAKVDPIEGHNSQIEIMACGPDIEGDPLYEKVLSVIQEASERVTIVSPYFIPDDVLLRSLIVKARTGKKVTLIVPEKSNHPITDLARKHYLRELQAAGVRILGYTLGMLHAKALVIDDRIAMTGSANMDLRSLFVNYEVAAFFYSQVDIRETELWIKDLEKGCREMGSEDLAHQRYLRGIGEDLCHLIAPLL